MNQLKFRDKVSLEEFLEAYSRQIIHDSEKIFVVDFLYPILGDNIKHVVPQHPFIDSEGRSRRIDFAILYEDHKLAFEVDGETYHAEGVIDREVFDDSLFRQNEILSNGWSLIRFSYNQLIDLMWRKRVTAILHKFIYKNAPGLLSNTDITPNYVQQLALDTLSLYRQKGWQKGVVILPTGIGKTYMSALDVKRFIGESGGRALFIVHRLDILSQAMDAYERIFPNAKLGVLTGEVVEHVEDCDILFASKDSLRQTSILASFDPQAFDYIVVDEVHHGQAPSYVEVIKYFRPKFMLGMTATPDRTDRKDILELFDYNKVFEYSLNDAIANGFLVPYSYYGLKDNIDYSNIRHSGKKYNVQDLDRHLIIEERNRQILHEYQQKIRGDKAIGFCCSIKHAEAMAKFFNENGVTAVAITSMSHERHSDMERFKDNQVAVAFTVDMFNEGIDVPNVRGLLFLRPTESRTVFMQQLGRGVRLSSGKDRVTILDFIGNYKKANKIRQYLSHSKHEAENMRGGFEKNIYEYAPNCEIHFDAEVEEILDREDLADREITREDLVAAYYDLSEKLRRKPTPDDINNDGQYRFIKYMNIFGSWTKFLREIGELTEASYHYPQGVHLGHILSIIKTLKEERVTGSRIDGVNVKIRGSLSQGRLGTFQRQTKYKLQALMELGLIVDDRSLGAKEPFRLELTPTGHEFYELLDGIQGIDLSFREEMSWSMVASVESFNTYIKDILGADEAKKRAIRRIFLDMPAVSQMLNYLYRVERKTPVLKSDIYAGFFRASFIKLHCEQLGIEAASDEGARHRCPFLLNILEAIGILKQERDKVNVEVFIASPHTLRVMQDEADGAIDDKISKILAIYASPGSQSDDEAISLLREELGRSFLTREYYLPVFESV